MWSFRLCPPKQKVFPTPLHVFVDIVHNTSLTIASTSPQKNDLCTRQEIGRVQRSFIVVTFYYIIENNWCMCAPCSVINVKYTDICGVF